MRFCIGWPNIIGNVPVATSPSMIFEFLMYAMPAPMSFNMPGRAPVRDGRAAIVTRVSVITPMKYNAAIST